jgi:hypothetical protein
VIFGATKLKIWILEDNTESEIWSTITLRLGPTRQPHKHLLQPSASQQPRTATKRREERKGEKIPVRPEGRERRRPRVSIYRRGSSKGADTRQPWQTQALCIGGHGWLSGTAVFLMDEATNTQWAAVFVVFPLESDQGYCTKYLPWCILYKSCTGLEVIQTLVREL